MGEDVGDVARVAPAPLTMNESGDGRRPELSVVVPAFNQAGTIGPNVLEIVRRLEAGRLDFEVVVVCDGSVDTTHAEAAACGDHRVRALRYERNMGKGYALRTGSAATLGRWIAWIDSDLDLDPSRIADFLDQAKSERLDVVVGSKRHPESEVLYPTRRRVYSWGYQQLVRLLFELDVRDTQVGMKLFRREVLVEVLPVVLVKRYAFDLEILAVARSFGFERIAEAPIRLDYKFGASGIDWRAIAQALWDTAAVFYRLRLLRFYERRRLLARRVAAHQPAVLPPLTVVLVPRELDGATEDAVARMRAATPPGTRVVIASPAPPDSPTAEIAGADVVNTGPGSRGERIARVIDRVDTEVTAFVDQDARPSHSWSSAALPLFGDPTVGAVVGPTAARLGRGDEHDAAGILSESRIGVGGARVRHHVGQLREVGDFPASNLFIRTDVVRMAAEQGHPIDDDLCAVVRRRHGLAVLCSPDVLVTTIPKPLFRPYFTMLHRLGRDRGRRITAGRLPRLRHVAPVALVAGLAGLPFSIARRGSRLALVVVVAASAYGATLAGFAGLVTLLHRRPRLGWLAAVGAAGSHVAFGVGIIRGMASRLRGAQEGESFDGEDWQ